MSEHIGSVEPTSSLEAITPLNLFLKHRPEQKQLIFQFPITAGKRPSRCHRLFTWKATGCPPFPLFLNPKYHRTSNWLSRNRMLLWVSGWACSIQGVQSPSHQGTFSSAEERASPEGWEKETASPMKTHLHYKESDMTEWLNWTELKNWVIKLAVCSPRFNYQLHL